MKKLITLISLTFIVCLCSFFTACGLVENNKDVHVHKYGDWIEEDSADTYCENKKFYAKCNECSELKWKQGSESDHEWSSQYTSDKDYHWYVCNNCSKVKGKEEHVKGNNGYCTKCNTFVVVATEGLKYKIENNKAIVTGYEGTDTDVVIPYTYQDYPVISIGSDAFEDCTSLTSVVLPNSVTSIGEDAFYNCRSLTSVNYLGTIDEWVQIEFSDYASNPLGYAKNLYINGELVTVANITTATKINNSAFVGCTSLTSVIIPNSVTSIGDYVFGACTSLTSVVIPNSVTSIGDYAFEYCFKLVEVVNKSTHITVEKGSTANGYVGRYALAVYNSNSGITESQLVNDNGYIIYTEGNEKILVGYNGQETNLVLPNYITKINNYAFYDCDSLTSIVIGNSVTSIGSKAFYYCTSLTSATIGDSITSIGAFAFSYCTSLTSIEIPNSVTSIGAFAFADCTSLTSVVIGDSVTSIGAFAFSGCCKIVEVVNKSTHITVEKGSYSNGDVGYYALAVYNSGDTFTGTKLSNDNGYIIYTEGNEKILVGYNGQETNLVLPNYITKINNYAFYYCDSLTSIEIPNSVTSIGNYAFYYCDSLTSVVIGNSVTSIGNWAFGYCMSLTSVVIPNSVISIGEDAFYYCSKLTSVVLPNSVTSIGEHAFYNCKSLKIYCEVGRKPSGWSSYWNYSNCPVEWGYKGN